MRAPSVLHRQVFRLDLFCILYQQPYPGAAFGGATSFLTEEMTELILPSRIEAIGEASAAAAQFAKRFGLSEDEAFGIDMAVREAVTNAVLHGNRQSATKTVELRFKTSPGLVEITVRDQGEGFDPESVPDPTDPRNVLKTSGRGILFMNNFMDEVEWMRHPEGGTIVKMTKKR